MSVAARDAAGRGAPEAQAESPGLLVAYAPFAKWSPHFETDLEVIQRHLDVGGRALVLTCEGQLRTCEPNPEHAAATCALCISRCRDGLAWLRGDVTRESFLHLSADEATSIAALERREWESLDELREFRIDEADIGLSAVSSVVSQTREPNPDVRVHRAKISAHLANAAMVYYSMRRRLPQLPVATFSVFNARFSALRPALRAAGALGIRTEVHERAGYMNRYLSIVDTYPHDLEAIKDLIEATAAPGELTEDERQHALAWYEERRAGRQQNWYSFAAAQEQGRLPPELQSDRLNLVVFNSSEDEFVEVEEWANPFYADQNEALERLLVDLAGCERLRLFLRVHPNLRGLRNSQVRAIEALAARHPELTVIPADSPVSSYALADAADLALSYGSTIGIEACYAGRPSLLMGRAMFEDLDVCIRPESHEACVAILREAAAGRLPALPEGREEGMVKFGHFNRSYGTAYRYMEPDGLFSARMRTADGSRRIRATLYRRLRYKFYCLVRLLRKWAGTAGPAR